MKIVMLYSHWGCKRNWGNSWKYPWCIWKCFAPFLWIMMSYKGPFCDRQKTDKQKYFPLERCLYNLKQIILPSQSALMVLPGMGYLSKPLIHHTGPDILLGRSATCPRCRESVEEAEKSLEVIYVCLKRGSLELFISNASDSIEEDVNRKHLLFWHKAHLFWQIKSLTMYPPLKLKSLPMTDHSCQHIF